MLLSCSSCPCLCSALFMLPFFCLSRSGLVGIQYNRTSPMPFSSFSLLSFDKRAAVTADNGIDVLDDSLFRLYFDEWGGHSNGNSALSFSRASYFYRRSSSIWSRLNAIDIYLPISSVIYEKNFRIDRSYNARLYLYKRWINSGQLFQFVIDFFRNNIVICFFRKIL